MTASHVTGGGFGAVAGVLLAGLLKHYGIAELSDVDASLIGSAALAAGIGLGHALEQYGIAGIARLLVHGQPTKPSNS